MTTYTTRRLRNPRTSRRTAPRVTAHPPPRTPHIARRRVPGVCTTSDSRARSPPARAGAISVRSDIAVSQCTAGRRDTRRRCLLYTESQRHRGRLGCGTAPGRGDHKLARLYAWVAVGRVGVRHVLGRRWAGLDARGGVGYSVEVRRGSGLLDGGCSGRALAALREERGVGRLLGQGASARGEQRTFTTNASPAGVHDTALGKAFSSSNLQE